MATVAAPYLVIPNLRHGYLDVVKYVSDHGKRVSPRGEPTTEVLDMIIVIEDPTDALPVGIGRGVNLKIAAAEALQLVGGFSDPGLMVRTSANFKRFQEDSGDFWGAYGIRIGVQIAECYCKLTEDPDTRQAVVTLWDPQRDNDPGKRDYPCTISLQFMVRGDRLIMRTSMRSNDVWWGLSYDAFQMSQLQLTLARCLGLEAGEYRHHAGSMHIYDRDRDGIDKLHAPTTQLSAYPLGFGHENCNIHAAVQRARWIGTGQAERIVHPTPSEIWYLATLQDVL